MAAGAALATVRPRPVTLSTVTSDIVGDDASRTAPA